MHYPPHDHEIQEVVQIIRSWGDESFREFPWRDPEKPWHGLVAEILLQRTRAENVISVYKRFLASFPTLEDFAAASPEEIEEIIRPLGLRWRAPLLDELGERLLERDGVPATLEGLMSLPGVGPYTAAAWLSFHGGGRGVLVDANIVRWICRMVGREYDGETRRKAWLLELAERITPQEDARQFNYAVLDFTMTICTPRNPHCESCPIGPRLCDHGGDRIAEEN